MKLIDYWKHFLTETVNLNRARIDKLDGHVGALDAFIAANETLGPKCSGDLVPQGSYAQRTIIKPVGTHEFDADVVLPMDEQDGWEPKDYVGTLYTVFRDSGTYREKVQRHGRCLRVNYADDFHVDIVPLLELPSGPHITNRRDNAYEATNPEGFNAWLDEQDRVTGGHLTEVIRVFKNLRDYKQTFDVKSVVLTFLLAHRVDDVDPATAFTDLPTAFLCVIEALDAYLQANPTLPPLTDHTCPSQNFADRWDQERYSTFRDRVRYYAEKTRAAFDDSSVAVSLGAWQDIFGDGFCKPPADIVEASRALVAYTDTEQDLHGDLQIPSRLSSGYQLRIRGTVRKHGRQAAFTLATKGNRVKKDRWIDFEVFQCNVPAPYTVYWKVRNHGIEAEKADQIRGQIHSGGRTREERTSYHGDHYVEAYVVKDGICVARNRQRVTVL